MTTRLKSAQPRARRTSPIPLSSLAPGRRRRINGAQRDAILDHRARGATIAEIERELALPPKFIRWVLVLARRAHDPRALTLGQAAVVATARRAEVKAARDAAEIEEAEREGDPSALRRVFADRMRAACAHLRHKHPDAYAGQMHLADLHEHHATFYPSLTIPSEEFTLPRFVPPTPAFSGCGSPADLCASV